MPKSSLETLIELAQSRKDEAARHLGALNSEGMSMEAKLALLVQYSEDYRARFQISMQQGLTASDWRNYQEFLNKLDAAIAQQREALALMQQRMTAGEIAWQSAGRVLNSYGVLVQRQTRAELLRVTRREQRETDEHARTVAARREPS